MACLDFTYYGDLQALLGMDCTPMKHGGYLYKHTDTGQSLLVLCQPAVLLC